MIIKLHDCTMNVWCLCSEFFIADTPFN